MPTFEELGLDPSILKALKKMQFKEPSSVQAETIPLIQKKNDLIALAKTGSGKTAACAIPICDRIDLNKSQVQALIIVPTRELALQYATEAQKIGEEKGVRSFAIYGGEDPSLQQAKLKHGVHFLVATPGRLIDFIYSRSIDLTHVETIVLDEADEMLSMGFYDDLEFIMQCLVQDHQTLLFSATMPKGIREIAKKHMKDPLEVTLTSKTLMPSTVKHYFLYCHHTRRDEALFDLLHHLKPVQGIIFCHSRIQCDKLARLLQKQFDGVDLLHAGLSQDMRTTITSKFRSGRVRFLVCTDVAARGLDVSGITHVFIYQLSDDTDVYVHRSGRTGRQERQGSVITLVTNRELSSLKKVLHHIKQEPKWLGKPPEHLDQTTTRHRPKKRNKSRSK